MLFSTFVDNVPKFCAFDDNLTIEKCYRNMCKSMKSLISDDVTRQIGSHQRCHQHNRIRWKKSSQRRTTTTTSSSEMSIQELPHHNQLAHKHQRRTRSTITTRTASATTTPTTTKRPSSSSPFTPPTINAVILFFIVLLSHDQMRTTATVHDARSRDSFNSIYQRNNLSVNNVIKTESIAAIDTNAIVNQLDIELPIDSFINVTNDDEFERLLRSSSNSKLRRDPIYQNEFAVYIPDGTDVADRIAAKHGFTNMGQQCGITGRSYTYSQMRDHCAALAIRLHTKFNLHIGEVIAVCLPNIPEFPIAALGAIEAGLILTTINPIYTAHEIQRQLEDSNAKAVISTPKTFAAVKEAIQNMKKDIKIVCVKTNADESIPSGAVDFAELIDTNNVDFSLLRPHLRHPDDMAFLPFSSGTTGLPKGVMLSHNNCEQLGVRIGENPIVIPTSNEHQDVSPTVLPLFHIYGFTALMMSKLALGVKLVTLPEFKPNTFLDTIKNHKATLLHVVPPIRYGLTETSPAVLFSMPGNQKYASVGQPASATRCKIVAINDSAGFGLPANQSGELWVKGPQNMLGYLNNQKATDEMLVDGWIRTGDIGHYDEDGFFYITDRLKELIKVKGFQVAPAELEEIIRSHPDVLDAAVVGVPHDKNGEAPRAFVIKRPESQITEDDVKKCIADKVVEYKQLEGGVHFLEAIPKNATGKIMRREIKLKYCQ